jgi:osmotically-inducible protein OsmY
MGRRKDSERYRGEWRSDDRGGRGAGYPRQDRYPSQMDDDVRSENYFGTGRQQFGGGGSDYGSGTMSESSWRSTRFSDRPDRNELGGGRNDRGLDANYDPGARDESRPISGSGQRSSGSYGSSSASRGYEPASRGYDSYSTSEASRGGFGSQGSSNDRERYAGDDQGERGWWDRATDEVSSWFGDSDAGQRRQQDGEHRGRGPKNYQRSDERIREDINDRLTDAPYLDASEIDVEVSGREVTLTGTVDSRRAKRMAEDIAESVSGVTHLENRIRVQNTDRMATSTSSASSTASDLPDTGEDNQASINQYRSAVGGTD